MYYSCVYNHSADGELDFADFMDFAYQVTERSSPFIVDECGLYEDESCMYLVDEVKN
jgi:hypothetical protein